MSNETWMNARKALDYGFCDEILFEDKNQQEEENSMNVPMSPPQAYSSRMMNQAILNQLGIHSDSVLVNKMKVDLPIEDTKNPTVIGFDGKTRDGQMPFQILMRQLEFLK
jgi:hypothetical protein